MIIRSESRVTRPYLGLEKAHDIFSKTKLLVDGQEYEQGSVVLNNSLLKSGTLRLKTETTIDELKKACDAAGVPHASASYVLIGRGRMFRRSTVVFSHDISSKSFKSEIEIDRLSEDRFVFNDESGFSLMAALVLKNSIKSKPLQVKLPGTWLGSSHFKLRPQNSLTSFSPLPLDRIAREKFGLTAGTYSYIDIQEDLLNVEDLGDAVITYLDEDVLNLLLTDDTESISIALQTQFAVYTIFTIGKQIASELISNNKELQDLGTDCGALRFLMHLSSECKIDANDLIEIAIKNEAKFQSIIESRFGLAGKFQKLLKGN